VSRPYISMTREIQAAFGFHSEETPDGYLVRGGQRGRARMYEIKTLIDGMRNGREKSILYYHYICGESIDRAADLLDISRRTGYRLHQKGLITVSFLMDRSAPRPDKPLST